MLASPGTSEAALPAQGWVHTILPLAAQPVPQARVGGEAARLLHALHPPAWCSSWSLDTAEQSGTSCICSPTPCVQTGSGRYPPHSKTIFRHPYFRMQTPPFSNAAEVGLSSPLAVGLPARLRHCLLPPQPLTFLPPCRKGSGIAVEVG